MKVLVWVALVDSGKAPGKVKLGLKVIVDRRRNRQALETVKAMGKGTRMIKLMLLYSLEEMSQ